MPRADFYLIAKPRFLQSPLRLVGELARRCADTGQATLILARDLAQAEELDFVLWDLGEEAYVAHQIAGREDDDDVAPVLIAPPEVEAVDRPLVINLRDVAFRGTCERVLEVVPADPAARDPQRARWREYQARGFSVHKHDM